MEIQNPNDFTANESAEVRITPEREARILAGVMGTEEPENTGDDYTGFLPSPEDDEPGPIKEFPAQIFEEDPIEAYLRELVVQQTRTADATEHLVSMMQEIVVVVGQTGGMVEGMLSGESGPKLGGPAGMILSALLPKGR